MPLVQPGQAHGDALTAEGHAAFQQRFAAGVERPRPGQCRAQLVDDSGVHTGTDQHLGTVQLVPQAQQRGQLGNALAAAPGTAARQHRVDAKRRRSAVGGAQIAGNVDAAMQRDGRTAAGVQQRAHGGQIKRTLRRQCADDKAVRPGVAQCLDLAAEQLDLVAGVQEIPRPRTHQAAHRQVQLGLDLPQQVGVGRQAAYGQRTAKFQPVRSPLLCGAGGGKAVNADFQQLHGRSHPFAFSPL